MKARQNDGRKTRSDAAPAIVHQRLEPGFAQGHDVAETGLARRRNQLERPPELIVRRTGLDRLLQPIAQSGVHGKVRGVVPLQRETSTVKPYLEDLSLAAASEEIFDDHRLARIDGSQLASHGQESGLFRHGEELPRAATFYETQGDGRRDRDTGPCRRDVLAAHAAWIGSAR